MDRGRIEQISDILNWLQSADLKSLFFGDLSGSHRTGIPNEIPVDKSLVLRPIGIVAWAYEWGVIFLVSYLLTVVRGIKVIKNTRARPSLCFFCNICSFLPFSCQPSANN